MRRCAAFLSSPLLAAVVAVAQSPTAKDVDNTASDGVKGRRGDGATTLSKLAEDLEALGLGPGLGERLSRRIIAPLVHPFLGSPELID